MSSTSEPEVRVFERVIDGKVVDTRHVSSESGAVEARFDGYVENTGKKPAAAPKTTGTPANNAG